MSTIPNNEIKFTFNDIRYGVGSEMLERGRDLVLKKKITIFRENVRDFEAVVFGSHHYNVIVSKASYDHGNCNCYMGQRDELCKHMIAVALVALEKNSLVDQTLTKDLINNDATENPKILIRRGLGKIKTYNGPSRGWFQYQNDLDVGVNMIRDALSHLEQNDTEIDYLFKLAQKINEKIARGGVDDSNGTVWPIINEILEIIVGYAEKNPCKKLHDKIKKWSGWNSGFDFENILKNYLKPK